MYIYYRELASRVNPLGHSDPLTPSNATTNGHLSMGDHAPFLLIPVLSAVAVFAVILVWVINWIPYDILKDGTLMKMFQDALLRKGDLSGWPNTKPRPQPHPL